MIKIKSGVYGFKDKHGAVRPKTSKSEAFSLSVEEEARLVKRGIAAYVSNEPVAKPVDGDDDDGIGERLSGGEGGSNGGNNEVYEKPDYSVDTNGNVLRKLMKNAGLPIEADMSKSEMVAALNAYYGNEDEDDGESPPVLGAAEPVP